MRNNITTKGMIEGALLAAIAFLLVLLGTLPAIGLFAMLFASIPITVATIRHGGSTGGLSAVLATLLVCLLLGPLSGISVGLQYMLLGWVLGYMMYHRKSGMKTLQAGIVAAAAGAALVLVLSLGVMGFSLDSINDFVGDYKSDMMEMYETAGLLDMMRQQGMSTAQITLMIQQMIDLMLRILPSMLILSHGLMAIVTYLLTTFVLKRLKIRIPRLQHFQQWILPQSFVWFLIAVWALWLATGYVESPVLDLIGLNGLILCCALLFFDGLALCGFVIKLRQISTPVKILYFFFLCFFFSGVIVACILMGLADLLFDFRKLRGDNKSVTKG